MRRGTARPGRVAAGVPVARRDRQVVVQTPALGVLVEPAAQPRPLAQERLVGDLRRAVAERDEPAVGQHREHAPHGVVVVGVELVERDAPADGAPGGVLAGQPQQDAARDRLLLCIEALVGRLRQPRDRAAHAAGAARSAARRSWRPSRCCHSSSSAVDSSGSAPGSPSCRPAAGRRGRARRAARRAAPAARSRGAARRAASARRARGWPPAARRAAGYAAQRP